MADVTVKKIDEMDSIGNGLMVRARGALGVTAFGMQVLNMPAGHEDYPNHSHGGVMADDGQEEVYIPLRGSARLVVGDEEWQLEPGSMARVGPSAVRKLYPGADGVQMLCIGGRPGQPYEVQAWTNEGGPAPGAAG